MADSGEVAEVNAPCSSNGDAAASLAAAFQASNLSAASFMLERDPPLHSACDSTSDDNDSSSGSIGNGAAGSGAPGARPQEAWRLKFLNKVGIQEPRVAQEAPPEFGRSTPLQPPSEHPEDDGGASAGNPVEVVVVRQSAARRSSDDIRLGYIKKLEHSRAFIPQLNRPKSSQTVTIFDWDDTLLCTSHLEMVQRQYGSIPTQVREQLASLERIVQTLLRHAGKTGKVFIITNASEGWVQHSSSLCMPGLQEDLAQVLLHAP